VVAEARALPDDKPSFEQLYRGLLQRIYAYVRSQVGNAADAEDVTAQVFIKAYQAYPRYESRRATPDAWVFQIARNAIADHHRRRARQERLAAAVAGAGQPEQDPAQMAEGRMLQAQLWAAVMKLGRRQREAVALRHLGLSFAEVGSVLQCSEDAAKMLCHRALKALRHHLGEESDGA